MRAERCGCVGRVSAGHRRASREIFGGVCYTPKAPNISGARSPARLPYPPIARLFFFNFGFQTHTYRIRCFSVTLISRSPGPRELITCRYLVARCDIPVDAISSGAFRGSNRSALEASLYDGLVTSTLSAFTPVMRNQTGVLCFVCYRAHSAFFVKVRAHCMYFYARVRRSWG